MIRMVPWFGADSVTVPAFGTTVGRADVAPIGGPEAGCVVILRDKQQAAISELEVGRKVLFAAGNHFNGIWEN